MGMVKRRNVELELVGDLRKGVSTSTVVTTQTHSLTRTRSSRSTDGTWADQHHGFTHSEKRVTGLVAVIRDLIEIRKHRTGIAIFGEP